MASALTGNKIKDSYQSLLKMGTNGSLDPTTLITISDGLGNDTPLQLAGDKLATNYLGNDVGLKLDFTNNLYQFGDNSGTTGKFSILELSSDPAEPNAAIVLNGNILRLYGNYGNVGLGYNAGMNNNDAVNYNYKFNSDWQIKNDDINNYPFFHNTLLNTFGNLTTTNKAMKYNFFANIQDPGFNIASDISLGDNEILSNAFVFGLNNYIGSNVLDTYIEDTNSTFPPTNVVVLNGSALEYNKRTNNVFSVNASEVITPDDTSGLVVLGGDYFYKDIQTYIPANHSFDAGFIPYGVTIQGNKALVKNSFTRIVSNSFEDNTTVNGKVQIEEKQLYRTIVDGTGFQSLLDDLAENRIYLQSNATYFVEIKIVSVSMAGIAVSSYGNWVRYLGATICVNSTGTLTLNEKDIYLGGEYANSSYSIDISNNNYFIINIQPNNASGDGAYVKADVKLNCITTN